MAGWALAAWTGCAWAGEVASATAALVGDAVTSVTVSHGGAGYDSEPAVRLIGGGGNGATAMSRLGGGRVLEIVVLSGGSGYTNAPRVSIADPPVPLVLTLDHSWRLVVQGPAGRVARLERLGRVGGSWTTWTNVLLGTVPTQLPDIHPTGELGLYRARIAVRPAGFVWVEPGTFLMGSPQTESGHDPQEKLHEVTLTRGFWIQDHEVTQAEYRAVMGSNPSFFKGDPTRPVEWVGHADAQAYCRRLTARERDAGRITGLEAYRLPTEAEWEYAARAGTTGAWYGNMDLIGWYEGNFGQETKPVRLKQPNPWGLYDMLGNVWEWVADGYGPYPEGPAVDPTGPTSAPTRAARGGGYYNTAEWCRAAVRQGAGEFLKTPFLGFRPVLSPIR